MMETDRTFLFSKNPSSSRTPLIFEEYTHLRFFGFEERITPLSSIFDLRPTLKIGKPFVFDFRSRRMVRISNGRRGGRCATYLKMGGSSKMEGSSIFRFRNEEPPSSTFSARRTKNPPFNNSSAERTNEETHLVFLLLQPTLARSPRVPSSDRPSGSKIGSIINPTGSNGCKF